MMELSTEELSAATGICYSTLIMYLNGRFSNIKKVKHQVTDKSKRRNFYIVTQEDINQLRIFKMKRMRIIC